jgi:deazaflavin-dependent oxidoreductase (nitroreductase family)
MILPRWVLRIGWAIHRGLYTVSRGRLGLEEPTANKLGTLRLRTRGRRSGEPRASFVFYVEDGEALAVVASNAGADEQPGWWLNLQAQPDAEVDVVGGSRPVRARVAAPDERARVWARFVALDPRYIEYEAATARPIDVVMLEPR